MSVLSILGSLFIIATFARWQYFRKPINRLVFFASFGNLLANVATLISVSALPGARGTFTALCEFQGIMIQWFMMADALWVFCMALNVMLVFYRSFDHGQLRRLEKWYLLFAYGLPGTIALAYIIMDHIPGRTKVIGPATIWCWVASNSKYSVLRLACFYVPVWVFISLTMCIYIATGRRIWKKRSELHSVSKQEPAIANPFTAIKVETEMKIETNSPMDTNSPYGNWPIVSTVSCDSSSLDNVKTAAGPEDGLPTGYRATAYSTPSAHPPQVRPNPPRRRTAPNHEGNAAAWGYVKVAFLMFAALFIVWVPSTVNRLQQFVNKDRPIFALNLASALVLPLQGFWNSMIYMSTTWPECKRAWTETMNALTRKASRRRHAHGSAINLGQDDQGDHVSLGAFDSRPESQRPLQSVASTESMRGHEVQREA